MRNYIKFIIPIMLFLLAGMAKGLSDRIDFHQSTLPGWMHTEFWLMNGDSSQGILPSWTRKYKNNDHTQGPAFFGSTTFLVFITDGWHLMQELYKWLLILGGIVLWCYYDWWLYYWYIITKMDLQTKIARISVSFLIVLAAVITVSLGFHITYR